MNNINDDAKKVQTENDIIEHQRHMGKVREQMADAAHAKNASDWVDRAIKSLQLLKGDKRSEYARYCAMAISELEKVSAFITVYIIPERR